jgi:transcriptional regulator with XRE-family HTH domain
MTIASRLDEAMKAARIPSQSALARASGVPQPTINRILKGTSKNGPETGTLLKLAAACNVTFEWLHEGIGAPTRGQAAAAQKTIQSAPSAHNAQEPVGYKLSLDELLHINAISEKEATLLRKYRLATQRGQEIIEDTATGVPKQGLAVVVDDQAEH